MKTDLVFLLIFGIIIIYIFIIYKVENMADVSNIDQIKEAVKQVYMADIEAIRNLSEVAQKIQANGLTIPAHANIRGRMSIGSNTNAKDLADYIGLSVENTNDTHIRLKTKADDNKSVYLINRDGHLRVNTHGIGDMFGVNRDGHTYNVCTNDNVHHFVGKGDNPYITLSKEGEWGGKSWYMQNVKNDGTNKIFRIGVHDEGPKLDIHKNGNTYFAGDINGPKNVNVGGQINSRGNILEKRNRARFIRVGNKNSELKQDSWTLIQIRVFDNNGTDVALSKPVTILDGSATNNTNETNITKGVIFDKGLQDNYYLGFHGAAGVSVLQIDLGAEYDLSQIQLFNRWNDSVDWRMNGTTIELFGADRQRNRIIHTGLWHRQYSKEFLL